MRKAYIFKRLTGQVKRLAAFMLITLMAVGNAFAEEVTFVFSEQGYENATELVSGTINDYISFVAGKGEASNPPKYYNTGSAIRFYPGSGNGNFITLIPAAGYQINGISVNENAGNTGNMGFIADGGEAVVMTPSGNVCAISGLNAVEGVKCYNAVNSTSGHIRIASITITYSEVGSVVVETPTFSVPAGSYYTPQTVSLSCATTGANIYYSINGGDAVLYNAPFTVSATTTVSACAVLGEDTSAVATANYVFPVEVANIAAFKAGTENQLYHITGDVNYVFRNGKNLFVQDATGGLLIYDNTPYTITTEYQEGDVISGLYGTLVEYNGIMEMYPTLNTAEGVAGSVTPVEVTVAELLANPAQYVSNLVLLRDGQFAAGSFNTSAATNVNFSQNGSTIVVRNNYKTVSATFTGGESASVVGLVTLYNGVPQLYPRSNADIITNVLPFTCSFENNSGILWTLVNGENANKWYIGEAAGFDNSKLYISSSNGLTNKYNVSAASVSHAYMDVTLPASDVLLTFDVRSMGEANDFLQVSLLDEAPEAGVLPATSLTRIYNVGEFSTKTILIPASYAGDKKLVFTWSNNNANGTQTPAAIDNVKMESTCTQVSNIEAAVNGQTAVVTWTAPEGQNSWTMEYKAADADAWQSVNATNASVTLNNLATQTTYDIRVKANCGTESSQWVAGQFVVPCVDGTTAPSDVEIGNGTSAGYNAPMNSFYKNSWTQMIYPASEFPEAGYINSLSWYVNAVNAHTYQTLKIYLGTTTASSHSTTSQWLSMDDLTLVYESNNGTMGSAVGWETYEFNTPFYYTPGENLVVVTARTADNYKSLNYRYTSVTDAVLYRRSDSSPENYGSHPGTNTGVKNANLPNMIVSYMDDCHDLHCAAPANLTVSNVTTTSATLDWEAGDATAWVLGCKAAGADEWTIVNLTENHFELTGLQENTTYNVRVMSDCGTIGMSNEVAVNFTTVANCIAPQNLTATAHTHTVNVSWLPVDGINQYEAVVTGVNSDYSVTLNVQNGSQFDLSGLTEGEQYNIKVRALCGEEETSDWSVINFTMPTICAAPTGLALVESSQNTATITWNEGEASSWTVEYGYRGFTLGTGTQMNVNENTVTLTGLNAGSNYDVYVMADCGLGYTSAWSARLPFMTACGPVLVTEEHPWFEDFEGYPGNGEQPFICWATPVKPNGPFVYCGYSSSCHSGSNSAELKGSTNVLVLPEFINDIHTLQISFWATATSTSLGNLEVGILTDMEDMDSFEAVATTDRPSTRNHVGNYMGPFSFTHAAATSGRIALRYTSTSATASWNLDDFTVELAPDCQTPSDFTVTATTTNSVTLSWTANGTETAWNIGVVSANGDFEDAVAADANPFTITGLNDATSYDFYVQANCGSTTSDWSLPVSATTKCLALATPYEENFDSYNGASYSAAGVAPTCWETFTDNSNKNYAPHVNTGANNAYNYAQSGKGLGFYANSSGNNAFAILPMFERPLNTMTLSFWRRMESAAQGVLTVGYVTDASDPVNSYTVVATIPSVTTSNNDYSVDFSTFEGTIPEGARMAFRWYKTGTWYTCAIDNVVVGSSQDASCLPVTDLTVSDVTATGATLSWTQGLNETSWFVSYKTADETDWTTVETTNNPYALTGLNGLTTYDVKVAPNCDGAAGPETATQLTTTCGNPCDYTFVLHDSWGDGWNGNQINLVFSDGSSQTLTLTSGNYGSFDVSIPEGATMTCNWTTGSYPGETSFEIVDGCDATVYEGANAQENGFFSGNCPMPACPKPSNITFSGITGTSAIVSWTAGGDETAWELEYKTDNAADWTVVSVTNNTYALTGLVAGTTYNVRVKAICSEDESSSYADNTFNTLCQSCDYTFVLHDSYGDGWNGNGILVTFSGGTTQTVTLDNGSYSTTTITIPSNESMSCTWVSGSYAYETSFEILNGCGLEVASGSGTQYGEIYAASCIMPTCPAPMALSATEVENGSSVITWFAGGEETSWQITLTPEEGDAITAVVTTPTYTITGMQPGDAYTVAVKALCGDDDESTEVTTTVICPALVDIALVNVYTNPSNCDLSNMIARITVKNVMESPITSFEAYYQVNGEGPVVHETVWPYLSFDYGETYTYTFTTSPTFTAATNVITAWVVIPSETNTDDNTATSGVTYLTAEQALPYVETFPASSVHNWAVMDNNADNSTFAVTGNALVYNGSDENVGNDVAVSPCVEYAPGTYLISFDYKANSPFYNEKVSLYYGPSTNLYNDYLVETLNFNNADYQRYNYVGAMYMSMDNIHVAFKAESPVGTDGFSIDNVSIKRAVSFSVGNDGNGSIVVSNVATTNSGLYFVGEGDEVTLHITSNFGYHVAGIYVNGVLVRGENPNNAIVDNFTFAPENGDYVYVTFTENAYHVNAVVNNLYVTAYNDNAPGAIYTPAHEVVAHGGSHTGVFTILPHFHLEGVFVNGMDCTDFITPLGNSQYTLTLSPVMEDKDINVMVDLDSTTITYTVLAGEGTINNTFVVDGTTTLPATYTVTLPGYADLLSTITPAPGYHVESIIIDGVEHNIIDIYSFEHLLGNHTVVVTFAPSHFVITTEGVGNGTVSNGVEFVYNPDITYVFTATPAVGSRIAYVKRNNVTLNVADPTVAFTDTLTNITTNYHYVAEFVDNTFTVTATAGAHGTVSPAGVASYFYHQTADYNINAAEGYYISSITVDGEVTNYTQADNLTSVVRTFANIEANHTISAAFAAKSYEITVNAGANGTIAPATATYAYGATPTFAITPNAGYVITDVTVDGASVGAVSSYTFTALTADHTIAATFAAAQFSIVATAGNGGTITPAGTTNMAYNGNQTYTISANAGYHVSDVFVDGASVGAVTSYSFTGVTANHTIYAAFEANEYTVTVNQPANGSITPGTTTVLFGATPSFVITPNMGYNVTAISVNGSNVNLSNVPSVNGVYTYTFAAVNANQTITATMTAKTYTITASAGSNGSITPNGNTTVNYGAAQTYTINPANGYVVENVTVDGMSMGALTAYTFTNVVANHTINATFKLAECEVPTFLYTTHIDSTSAELHWSHPSATSFDIQYKTPTGNLANVSNVSGNSYVLTDLTPNTTYLWQVRANCTSSNHSDWSNLVSFKTDATTIDNTGIEDVVMNNVKVWAEHQNVHILNNEGMNIENVRIFNAYGKLIYSGAVNTTHEVINLNVAAGTYIVNVTTDQGVANYKVTILK